VHQTAVGINGDMRLHAARFSRHRRWHSKGTNTEPMTKWSARRGAALPGWADECMSYGSLKPRRGPRPRPA
jgi:hypothetical protein